MKLIYRGRNYERQSAAVNAQEVTVKGTYRGAKANLHQFKGVSMEHPKASLTYRGVSY